jgi:hypothetical protein
MRAKKDPLQLAFSKKSFMRTLSYREFFTSFSLALFLLACYMLLDYYGSEDWVRSNFSWVIWVIIPIVLLFNHVFYKIEHGRSNNFIGRSLHDVIFLLSWLGFYLLSSLYQGVTVSFPFANEFSVILPVIVGALVIVLFESLVACLKWLLRLAGWQIL